MCSNGALNFEKGMLSCGQLSKVQSGKNGGPSRREGPEFEGRAGV